MQSGRATGLVVAAALVAGAALAATSAPAAGPLSGSVRDAFSGQAREEIHRYKEWILQLDNECYYDSTIDNEATVSWTAGFAPLPLARLGRFAGRSLAAAKGEAAGRVTGAETRGDCGNAEAPPDWMTTIPCDEALTFPEPASLEVQATKGRAVVEVRAPRVSTQLPTGCGLNPRNDQLVARVTVELSALAKLKKGKSLTVRVGTGTRSGSYTPELNCQFQPAPYEGYFITDECRDTLTWRGTVTLTKL